MSDTGTPGRDVDVDRVVRGLAGLLDRDSVSEDHVRLRMGLFQAQAAILRDLAQLPVKRPSEVQRGQLPLLRREDICFDQALAARLFDAVAGVLVPRQTPIGGSGATAGLPSSADTVGQANRGTRQSKTDGTLERHGNACLELPRLRSAVSNRPELLDDLMRRVALASDEECLALLAGRLRVPPELLLFLGRLLAAPFVTNAAGRVREEARRGGTGIMPVAPSASDGTCPLCGSTPGLASLRPDDGARVLHCSLCGHSWPFGRLECPFCTSPDRSALTRIEVAGEEARWIEACDQCRQYLKVVDRRRLAQGEEFIPLVEEVGGLYLDLVAEKEGYLCKPPYAAVG